MGRARAIAKSRLLPQRPVRVGTPDADLTLRPMVESDRSAFIDLVRASRGDLDAWSPLHLPGEDDDAMFLRQLRLTREGDQRDSARRRLGVLADGSIIGAFNLNEISRGLVWECDANWWVATPFAGRGLATLGVRAMLRVALSELPVGLGLQRVVCGILPGNIASTRIAAKVGLVRQENVATHLRLGGQWRLHDVYVATPESIMPRV